MYPVFVEISNLMFTQRATDVLGKVLIEDFDEARCSYLLLINLDSLISLDKRPKMICDPPLRSTTSIHVNCDSGC